jgi:simple sugar transport system permease protein
MNADLTPQEKEELVNPRERSFALRLATATDWRTGLVIPLLAILTALIIGVIIIMLTGSSFSDAMKAYAALVQGSVGSLRAISETLTAATPLIFAGLSVALAFRAGLSILVVRVKP